MIILGAVTEDLVEQAEEFVEESENL